MEFFQNIATNLNLLPEKIRRGLRTVVILEKLYRIRAAEYKLNLLNDDRYRNSKRLNRHEIQVFSQNGEDGIIREIFRRIGVKSKVFVEIGVGDGLENNTTFLLLQNWKGYWIDGNLRAVRSIHRHFKQTINDSQLSVICSFVTAENIQNTLQNLQVPREFDLLSIDIDRNTYWVWEALRRYEPRVVVIEYNAAIPADIDWKIDYVPSRSWNGTSYYGASLKAYELLGSELGYNLVGCDMIGVNAFFVRKDLCNDKFEEPFTAENHYEPVRYFLSHRINHHPASFNDDD
jgi:hypothetical protein